MRTKLELNCLEDKTFLNFWDCKSGDDVVCEVTKEGELLHKKLGKISLLRYIELIKEACEED